MNVNMASSADYKDISKFELRDIIDAVSNQIIHLEKSQKELAMALEEDPGDEDFRIAYDENIGVIASKRQKREEYKAHLKEIDPAYYMQHYSIREETASECIGNTAEQHTDVNAENSSGVYL